MTMQRCQPDIVKRLRDRDAVVLCGLLHAVPTMLEAADRIEELTKALQFYADARRYQGANQHPIPNDPYGKPDAAYIMDVTRDGGAIAYRALRVPLEQRNSHD